MTPPPESLPRFSDRATGRRLLSLDDAADVLRRGGVVGMPTETVYGLAADAFNALAVARIFEVKDRPRFDPLIVHIAATATLETLASDIPDAARALAARFWPGPLTLVLPRRAVVPDIVTAGLETVAVRLPSHPLALALIEKAATPLAAPSANRFGEISPTRADDVIDRLGERIDGVLDGGPCTVGIESTIIGFWGGRQWLLRPGGIAREDIEACIGQLERYEVTLEQNIPAPGLVPRHYAPRTPLSLRGGDAPDRLVPATDRIGRLIFGATAAPSDCAAIRNLDPAGDLRRAAANLYRLLRELDDCGLDRIIADPVPDLGLGIAINDRLRRAAQQATHT